MLAKYALMGAVITAGSMLLYGTAHAAGGAVDVLVTDVTTAEELEIGEAETLFSLDQILVASGEGIFNNLTGRCLGLEEVENATGASVFNGFCTYVDADGDKIFTEISIERASLTDEASGPAKITGGTGKFQGISGNLTQTRMLLLPGPKDGVFPGIGSLTGWASTK